MVLLRYTGSKNIRDEHLILGSFLYYMHLCLYQLILMAAIPDEPREITIQQARMEILKEKAIRQIPDDTLGGDDVEEDRELTFKMHSYIWSLDDSTEKFTEEVLVDDSDCKKEN